jgi:hypothetical protein
MPNSNRRDALKAVTAAAFIPTAAASATVADATAASRNIVSVADTTAPKRSKKPAGPPVSATPTSAAAPLTDENARNQHRTEFIRQNRTFSLLPDLSPFNDEILKLRNSFREGQALPKRIPERGIEHRFVYNRVARTTPFPSLRCDILALEASSLLGYGRESFSLR